MGRLLTPEQFFEHVVAVVEESKRVAGASGKLFHVVRDWRELGYGVLPTAPGLGGKPAHRQEYGWVGYRKGVVAFVDK